MPAPSLWDRLRGARLVQILLVYLGASWVVLQIADVLAGALSLPEWVLPVAVLLLLVGLVIILATAWVQSLPSTTAREAAGEVPTDWQVAPGDLLTSLKAGRLPHLTWGRAILGGAVALSLLFGGAGLYVLVAGTRGLLGPTEVAASGSPTAVVILPFQTRGEGLEVYGEGLVDLLTSNLEGLGGIRTVNAGTVVSRWRSQVGESFTVELDEALRVAGGLDARYAVRGSAVAAGTQVRVVADVYDLADGRRVGGTRVEGAADAMLALVDGLTVDLAEVFVGRGAEAAGSSLHTRSLPALEAYLRGEALYRESRFREAVNAFDEAVAADTMFALAYRRLAMSWGWLEVLNPEGRRAAARAAALADRLPERERLLTRSEAGMWSEAAAILPEIRAHLRLHPQDWEAWEQLAELALHSPWMSRVSPEEAREALERAIALQPRFTPRYFHLLDYTVAQGNEDSFRELLTAYEAQGAEADAVRARQAQWDFFHGSAEEMAAAEAYLRGGDPSILLTVSAWAATWAPRLIRAVALADEDVMGEGYPVQADILVMVGRGPAAWPTSQVARGFPHLKWGLLGPEDDPVPPVLLAALETGPTIENAWAVAVLAARSGDATSLARARAALASADFASWDPAFYGPLGQAEALRYPDAVERLRDGDPEGALALLSETLAQPGYNPLATILAGDAHAAAGRWSEALSLWETLLDSLYRAHVRLRQGRAYEALGDTARAREAFGALLAMWADAEPGHPALDEAREALARLGG